MSDKRHHNKLRPWTWRALTTLAACQLSLLALMAQHSSLTSHFNDERPVTIVCDWDKPPYEFLNDMGQPSGSNIDIMRAIMDELSLPCRFVMKEWGNAIKTFERGEADLILANSRRFRSADYAVSENIINYNRIVVATSRRDSVGLVTQRMLEQGHAVFKPSDYAVRFFIDEDSMRASKIEFQTPKVALNGIAVGDNRYFVGDEASLKWKIKELNLDGISLCDVSIPISEIHFIGRNQELIDEIDDHYSRMKQRGEIESIHNRWFHPERVQSSTPPVAVYAILAILVLIAVAYMLYRLSKANVSKNTRAATDLNSMMTKALEMEQHVYNTPSASSRQEPGLEHLQLMYDSLFNTPLIAMAFYDKDGWPLQVNDAMKQVCGYANSDNARYWNSLCLFDIPLFRSSYAPGSRDDLTVCQHMEYPEMGINKYIEFHVQPIFGVDGEIANYVCSAIDMTDERQRVHQSYEQEKRIRHTNEQINHYEHRLRYLLANGKMYVWQSDEATRTIQFTRTMRQPEFTETYDDYLARLVEDQRQPTVDLWNNPQNRDKMLSMTCHFQRMHNENRPQWCYSVGFPLYDDNQQVKGCFGIIRDITDLVEAQQQLREETARANDSGHQKSMFLASMTHEIRTPLNSIVGFSDLLRTVDTLDERHEFIRIIRTNCDMLLRLISDILEASSINDGPQSINPADVDFAKAFDDICHSLEQRVQQTQVAFITENPYPTLQAHLDIGRIQQVITNFVINAVKYTTQGHIRVGYRLENDSNTDNAGNANNVGNTPKHQASGGQQLYIYCEDTGAGIPYDKQADIFERFVKLNEFVQGTGLGLSICKSIAERCGGTIGVDSKGLGHGSTFWIKIPIT